MRRYFYLIWRECREEIVNEIYCQRFLIPPWENLSYCLPLLSVQKRLYWGLILRLVCCCVVTVMGRCCYYSCGCVLLCAHQCVEDLTQKDVINTTGEIWLTLWWQHMYRSCIKNRGKHRLGTGSFPHVVYSRVKYWSGGANEGHRHWGSPGGGCPREN